MKNKEVAANAALGNFQRQYVGARYVPKFANPIEWNQNAAYEALTIVTYLGSSYTSKIPVPAGTDILNKQYWVLTGNYNAQVEEYRKAVQDLTDYLPKSHEYKNVKDYGAVGDGVTDDTAAIQAAINDKSKNTTFFPKGVYLVKGIEVFATTHLIGCGEASMIKLYPGLTKADSITDSSGFKFNGVPVIYNSYNESPLYSIIIENIGVDGNGAAQTSEFITGGNSSGIYINNVTRLTLRNVTVRNAVNHGICLKMVNNSNISNIKCLNSGYGMKVTGQNVDGGDGIVLIQKCEYVNCENIITFNGMSIGFEIEGRFGGVYAGNRCKHINVNNLISYNNRGHNILVCWSDFVNLSDIYSYNSTSYNGIEILGSNNINLNNFIDEASKLYGILITAESYGEQGRNSHINISNTILALDGGINMDTSGYVSFINTDINRSDAANPIKIDACGDIFFKGLKATSSMAITAVIDAKDTTNLILDGIFSTNNAGYLIIVEGDTRNFVMKDCVKYGGNSLLQILNTIAASTIINNAEIGCSQNLSRYDSYSSLLIQNNGEKTF